MQNIHLTQKTAKALVKKVFGVSGASLERERAPSSVCIYKMRRGDWELSIHNDWFSKNGRYFLLYSNAKSGIYFASFHDPDTLEKVWFAEDECLKDRVHELMEGRKSRPLEAAKTIHQSFCEWFDPLGR